MAARTQPYRFLPIPSISSVHSLTSADGAEGIVYPETAHYWFIYAPQARTSERSTYASYRRASIRVGSVYSDFLGAAAPLAYLLTSVTAWNCRAPFLTPSQTWRAAGGVP